MARFIHIPLFLVFACLVLFLLLALLCLKKSFLFSLFLVLAIFCSGFFHLKNAQTFPPDHISKFVGDQPQEVYLIGKVVTNPEVSQTFYHTRKTTFTFQVQDLKVEDKWQAVFGLVKVTLYGERAVQYQDKLLLQGTIERPPGLRNPGGFNYRAYLANHHIFALFKVKEKDAFKLISSRQSFIGEIFKFKQKLQRLIYTHLKPEQASLLSAILLGERANLSWDMNDLFINTGTIHILAISGLHVGLIAFIFIACFKFLRLGRNLTFILTIFLLISYALLSGARPSVLRATIMATVVLLGFLFSREIKIYNSLGLAALLILIVHPQYLFDAGFQLSFLSVISLVYFTPQIEKLFSVNNRYLAYFMRAFSVSLSCWMGIAPITAYYFNIVTPVAVLANLVVIPWLFLVVSVGVSFLIFGYIWSALGAIFAQTSWFTLSILSKLVAWMAKIPLGFFHCPQPSVFFFASYYLLLLLIFNRQRLNISRGKLAIILLLAANSLVWPPLFRRPSCGLTVTFLDVGLGEAIFIQFPCQGTMLIDAGDAGENDAGRWAILPFLWSKGIGRIDAVVLTHPDDDHVGGLATVLENVKVNYVFDNGMAKDSQSFRNYSTMVKEKKVHYYRLKEGEKIFGFPEVELFVLHPPQSLLPGTVDDANNNSLVLKLAYKDVSFLFCADIQKEAIERLLSYSPMLESTIIKVPHHGSDEGGIEDYLFQEVSPQLAVISVDKSGRFNLPASRVVDNLAHQAVAVYQTKNCGAIIISTDGKGFWVETMVGAAHIVKP